MKRMFPPNKDCRHRMGRHCRLTKKAIVLDIRDPEHMRCWNRYGCDSYEAVE